MHQGQGRFTWGLNSIMKTVFNVLFPNTNPGQFWILRKLKQITLLEWYHKVNPAHRKIFKYVKKGDIVVDIGANRGDYTNQFLKRGAFVYAFEPSAIFRSLFHRYEHHKMVKCISVALGKEDGETWLNEFVGDGVSTTVTDNLIGYDGMIMKHKILVRKLDDFNLEPDFIKIDTEGMDYEVLLGAKETLKKHRPKVLIECCENRLNFAGYTIQGIHDFMTGLGYHGEKVYENEDYHDMLYTWLDPMFGRERFYS